jgi:Putative peptidoglycan binding domain/NlpC/P60 family
MVEKEDPSSGPRRAEHISEPFCGGSQRESEAFMSTVKQRAVGARGKAPAKPRTLHLTDPYMEGPDVEELQKLLKPFHPGKVDRQYGAATAAAVERAKWALGYPDAKCTGDAGPQLIAYLKKEAPVPPEFKALQAVRKLDGQKSLLLRQHIVENARWGMTNEPKIHYRQSRPMDGLHEPRKLPLSTDCSGFSTLCYAWAGAPDPNGLNYSGLGFTGTLLQHMKRIPQSAVQPGDMVVWGGDTGHHVALVVEAGPDPLLCSHGQEKGPFAIRFSVESKYQPPQVTWLSSLR